jgi:hypothetical protein
MKTPDTVVQHIRFALECLSERSGHHEFEELCRCFARLRISIYLLPATGPVSGGGDQGRDFETFRTYINGLGEQKFGGIGDNQPLAFACSLHMAKGLPAKIRKDINSIMAGTVRPVGIYFFATAPVTVARRHALQAWAKATHGIHLELLDGRALAEQLVAPDLFWIASRYLSVSPEVLPESQTDDEYSAARAKWFDTPPAKANYADFIECKRAARRALDDFKEDLLRWIGQLTQFETLFAGSAFWPLITYEIIALTMRLTRSFIGQEERIRHYLGREFKSMLPDEIENAMTIASYSWTARERGAAMLEVEEIRRWFSEIGSRVASGLAAPGSQNQKCLWLRESGRIRFQQAIMTGQRPDLAEDFSPWVTLADECATARLFPVQELHDDVLRYAGLLGDHPIFDEILTKLRPILGKRAGSAAIADSYFERAKQFVDRDEFLRAIHELHAARIEWFSDETIGLAAFACRVLANCYCHLGLNYAGLYYALSAAFVTANATKDSLNPRTPECLFQAVEAAYKHARNFCDGGRRFLSTNGARVGAAHIRSRLHSTAISGIAQLFPSP